MTRFRKKETAEDLAAWRVPLRCCVVVSLAVAISASARPAWGQVPQGSPADTSPHVAPSKTPGYLGIAGSDLLQPGDIVRIKIWREPDLSGDFEVDDRGTAVFPKIGSTHVTEISPDSLKRYLVAIYTEYLKDPAIDVTMLRRVTVLGAVKNPGLYPVDPTMRVSDVLALAGGATTAGDQKKLELLRGGVRQDVTFTASTPVGELPMRSGDQIFVPERGWLSRNGYVVGALITGLVIVSTAYVTRH